MLDAPRQHELNAKDLRSFIERFHKTFSKETLPVQLVFSATDSEVIPEGCIDQLWAPGFDFDGEPRFLGPAPDAGGATTLTVAAHFHSGHKQIMMVLDHAQVDRLGAILPDLAAATAARQTWPGKDVTVRWSGGRYETKLVHHKDNGNVKFTVRKREARRLWDYLDDLLRRDDSNRDVAARYILGRPGVLDEFFVDDPVPQRPART